MTYPDGRWLRFESNAVGLRTATYTSDGEELHYPYTPGLQLESLTDGNGVELARYEYDPRGRLVRRTRERQLPRSMPTTQPDW